MTVIDLDTHAARCLVLRGRRIHRWGRIALGPPEVYDYGLIRDPDEVGRRLQKLLGAVDATAPAILLLSAARAIGDRLTLPPGLPRAAREPALTALFGKRLGGADAFWLHPVWIRRARPPQAFVLAVVREAVTDPLRLLTAAGLPVRRVELAILALARLRRVATGVVVWFGPDGQDSLLVMQDGQPTQVYARAAAGGREWLPDTVYTAGAGAPLVWAGPGAPDPFPPLAHPVHRLAGPPDLPPDFLPAWAAATTRPVGILDLHPDAKPAAVRQAPWRAAVAVGLAAAVAAADVAQYRTAYAPRLAALRLEATTLAAAQAGPGGALARQYLAVTRAIQQAEQDQARLTAGAFPWQTVVAALTAAAGGVTLTQASINTAGTVLTVTGTAPSLGSLTAFTQRLGPPFGPAQLTQMSLTSGGVQFSLTIPLHLAG